MIAQNLLQHQNLRSKYAYRIRLGNFHICQIQSIVPVEHLASATLRKLLQGLCGHVRIVVSAKRVSIAKGRGQ